MPLFQINSQFLVYVILNSSSIQQNENHFPNIINTKKNNTNFKQINNQILFSKKIENK